MKATTSRTGLHKVRVGDRVVIRGNRCCDDVVTKIGRLLIRVAKAFRGYASTSLTESQLDRIIAILDEVQP